MNEENKNIGQEKEKKTDGRMPSMSNIMSELNFSKSSAETVLQMKQYIKDSPGNERFNIMHNKEFDILEMLSIVKTIQVEEKDARELERALMDDDEYQDYQCAFLALLEASP